MQFLYCCWSMCPAHGAVARIAKFLPFQHSMRPEHEAVVKIAKFLPFQHSMSPVCGAMRPA
ncbi:hypothetical protein A2U01_0059256 [Trifolium medium]|uniref:Uncharacterized protein n=1 Tax=Trifolium medium TaxID=97028 RepID=A0A392RN08_9FABA|nr:hypothetical protein [Trifolium medium]